MRYFLKGFWQKHYDEVTEKQYRIAEKTAGKFTGGGITTFFNDHGVSGRAITGKKTVPLESAATLLIIEDENLRYLFDDDEADYNIVPVPVEFFHLSGKEIALEE